MYANPALWRSKRNREFEYWKTKGLYVGTQSAVLWDRIEGHRSYKRYIGFLHAFVDQIAHPDGPNKEIYRDIDNIISFGPGGGKTDLALVTRIKAHNDTISYVPIDINPTLASMAATEVSSDGLVRVPFLVADDFESNHRRIKDVIDGNAHELGHRNLFVMLGGTFSNLDETESRFFLKMKDWMGKDDYFLLDVNIYDKDASKSQNFVKEMEKALLYERDDAPDYSSFLAYAIVNKHPRLYRHTVGTACEDNEQCRKVQRVEDEEILSLSELLDIKEIPIEDARQYSHVEETKVLVCRIKDNERAPDLLILRRYCFDAIKKELEKHFEVEAFNGIKDYNEEVHRASFLLKLKLPDSDRQPTAKK
uniref:Histidine-specific methyltransferase SAM-dependent domain-containing protein n=1 Tax=Candidatus Kentrum sp. TUN TaxID=2126343 RepID=A0A450ZSF5_9GAMM|nr:MAG: hypothetical protein BECKTUN1418D_GA0071000_10522 [Candidatus Kentron sp. TUN]